MAKLLKLRRGTTTQHGSFTGAEGEVTVDTDKDTLVVHDGSTAGGHPVAAEDMANVSSASIAGRLANDSIAVSKIAAGTLPSDVKIIDANVSGNLTIESADIVDGTIVNADVNASAAIAGTKVSPDFGSQNVVTTGTLGSGDLTITSSAPKIEFYDSNANSDFKVIVNDGKIKIQDITNSNAVRFFIDSSGTVDVAGNLDVGAGVDVTGNITVSGTVDGRDVAADGTKLDGIESSATADQTAAEIRTLVESASDSNVFTDADHSKLNGIEASATADQTAAEIRTLVESASDSNVFTDADHTKLNGIESSATADQTGAEIAALLDGQNLHTDGEIGRDAGDYIKFSNNSHCDMFINGNNEFRFEADGDFHADGDVIAYSTSISSDEKLKENIEIVPNALEKLESLNGVTFDWKRDGTASAGVIAQNVQQVLPQAVKEVKGLKDNEPFLTVNYHALTSILIEAVKDLSAKVKELEAK